MTFIPNENFYLKVAKGEIPKHSIIHKFGATNLTTTLRPITYSGTYKTPTTATALEFVSSSSSDASESIGARQITIVGTNASGDEVTQVISTNGTTAVSIPTSLLRLYRWYVSSSGTYATATSGSHVGTLTIRESGGGATWSTIPTSPFTTSQSQIGVYTIPNGYTAYLINKTIFVDSSKSADIYFFKRGNILDVTPPYESMRLVEREVGVSGGLSLTFNTPKLLGSGPMDVGFMGKMSSGTSECSVEFEILLVQD